MNNLTMKKNNNNNTIKISEDDNNDDDELLINEFFQQNQNELNMSSNGMSILGFHMDDDDDDDSDDNNNSEDSLLVSPILNDYILTKRSMNDINVNHQKRSTTNHNNNDMISSPVSTSFMSPTIYNNINSSSKRTRSSARLRRRRQILFSSPREEIFRLEEEQEKTVVSKNGERNHDDDVGDNDVQQSNFEKSSSKEKKISSDINNNNSLLHGALLDTSLCPSLGLGSSIGEEEVGEEEEENNDEGEEVQVEEDDYNLHDNDDDHNNDNKFDYIINEEEIKTTRKRSSSLNSSSSGLVDCKEYNEDVVENQLKTTTEETKESISSSKNNANERNDIQRNNTMSSSTDDEVAVLGGEKIIIDKGICLEEEDNTSKTISHDVDCKVQTNENNEIDSDDVLSKQKQKLPSTLLLQHDQLQEEDDMVHKMTSSINEHEQNSLSNNTTEISTTTTSKTLKLTSTPDRKSINNNSTPPRSSNQKRSSLSLTPKLMKEAAKQTLTPVLNALRSKLRRSRQSFQNDIEAVEMVDTKCRDDNVIIKGINSDTKTITDEGIIPSSSTEQINEDVVIDHGVGDVIDSSLLSNKEKLHEETSFISSKVKPIQDTKTPGKFEGNEKDNGNQTPEPITSPSLSLTPALKAFRSKLLGKPSLEPHSSQKMMDFSISPIGNSSPNTIDETSPYNNYRGSLYSPPIREPVVTGNNTPDNNSKQDDSYLAQPKDLNSAKKNVNEQSSALVHRLRGAAQKRMADLTKKRDSLAAKEVDHLGWNESELNQQQHVDTIPEEDSLDSNSEKSDKELKTSSKRENENNVFKARPLPASSKEGGCTSGVPKLIKKPATKAISPKLGSRRPTNHSDRKQLPAKAIKKKKKDPFYVSPFKARPLPTFINDDNKENRSGVPKLKKQQPTIPKSPLLGLRRNRNISDRRGTTGNSKIHKKEKNIVSPMSTSTTTTIDPVGLGILANTPTISEQRNIPASNYSSGFSLHSAKRARDRAQFNQALSMREKEREKQKRIEVDLLIKQRMKELESMKQALR